MGAHKNLDPMTKLTVCGREVMCLVDTGAKYSTVNEPLLLSDIAVRVAGFSGKAEEWPLSEFVPCQWNNLHFYHRFLVSTNCPVNLLGRDIMCELNVGLLMYPDRVEISFPNGQVQMCCTARNTSAQMLLGASEEAPEKTHMTIWWGKVPDCKAMPLWTTLSSWGPWISSLRHYETPADVLHCTMNCAITDDENYDILWTEFQRHCDDTGEHPLVELGDIFVAPDGIASEVKLSAPLEQLFVLGSGSAPHVTLKLAAGCEGKSLGPLIRSCLMLDDWVDINTDLSYSHSTDIYRIKHTSVTSL
ncbi:uncharacterized protein LOC106512502, partial [Austrofundulus limnaeus]|uniref:Uncharacterized protein LOC106512502 n=1 Tax=Austrofundulus limnaeus TaxID=52670 RepID=A0A2I4AM41_AUSLI